jgi:hypothetical protein
MASQTSGLKRNTVDKFYTKQSVVDECCNKMKDFVTIDKDADYIIEPSAGNGSFINNIKTLSNQFEFYDIQPDDDTIIKQDYLTLDLSRFTGKKCHVIGNPPFGRQSSLAIKFIKRSAEYADSVSFILPKSFKKDSLKNKVPLNFHCVYEWELPINSFLINDVDHDVPCVFQIWVKKAVERVKPQKLTPNNFIFVKKDSAHDISFRRVGVYAGNVSKDTEDKSVQSHYFIKFNDGVLTDEAYNKIKSINFGKSSDTVGPKSISKQELIKEFNMIL